MTSSPAGTSSLSEGLQSLGAPIALVLSSAIALTLAPPLFATEATSPTVALDTDPAFAPLSIVATGLDDQALAAAATLTRDDWRAVFPVYTGSELPTDGRPPVAGRWTVEADAIRFRPRFPIEPGVDYVARLDVARLDIARPDSNAQPIVATFGLPAELREPSTVVSQVYPTADELPENLLRLYLHFSAPMSRGEAYRHIQLLDGDGRPAERVFLDIEQELWDPGMRRLTLFFDPGRIKRGLRPHFEAGPPLAANATYRLVIDADWRDAEGQPLASGFEKTFRTTAADRRAPDPADWTIEAPSSGGRGPLSLAFPEPLDHGLLQRVLTIEDASGRRVAGDVEIFDHERRFAFQPR
ncbi:MAG: Ig-like domain-containing protein, partial [Acidobacteriota bacterium]